MWIPNKRCMVYITMFTFVFLISHQGKNHAAYNDDSGYKIAADYLNKGLYLESLGIYQEIVTHSDDRQNRAKALLFMGNIYSLFLDQYEDALNQYGKVIHEYPESMAAGEAVFNSGMVLYESSRFKDAYAYFSQYIRQYSDGLQRQSAEVWADSAKSRMNEKKTEPPSRSISLVSDTTIRVLVKDITNKATIRAENVIRITDPFSGKSFYAKDGVVNLLKTGAHLSVNGLPLETSRCQIDSQSDTMVLDNRRFRGELNIMVATDGFQIVNCLPIEQYLYGVVPLEMSPRWPKSALMAQAVASRTYALYIKSKSKDKAFDVVATTASQVYGGFDREVDTSTQSVELTQGQVITHDGKLIVAYFHADSGGYTEDAQNVWSADLPYLKAAPDRYSGQRSDGIWEYTLGYGELRDRLNQYGLNIGKIRTVVPLDRTVSGRTRQIRIISDNGSHILDSNAFRIKVDPTKMKSTLLNIESGASAILIGGKGYGHGVGMSQWGAKRMAEEGFNYREILKHYYKDIDIVTLKRS